MLLGHAMRKPAVCEVGSSVSFAGIYDLHHVQCAHSYAEELVGFCVSRNEMQGRVFEIISIRARYFLTASLAHLFLQAHLFLDRDRILT